MVKRYFLILIGIFAAYSGVFAQRVEKSEIPPYHRSSLRIFPVIHMQDSFANEIAQTAVDIPFPDKYDKIRLLSKTEFLGIDDKCNFRSVKDRNAHVKFDEYIAEQKMAHRIIADWFNMDKNSNCNTKKLADRGFYDLSEMQKQAAAYTTVGASSLLADAGDELIKKSFVVFNEMAYISHDEQKELAQYVMEASQDIIAATCNGIRDILMLTLGLIPGVDGIIQGIMDSVRDMLILVLDVAKTTNEMLDIEGFKVLEYTHLYQLNWDDEIANTFYSKYYRENEPNPARYEKFLNDTTFKMRYVGSYPTVTDNASSGTWKSSKATAYANQKKSDQIRITCARTQDAALSKLQTLYPEFRVATPITGLTYNAKGKPAGVMADIGEKESIAKKKFAVWETQIDPQTQRTKYVKVGVVAPDQIWDNRYEAAEQDKAEGIDIPIMQGSTFEKKSGTAKVFTPGYLIRETDKREK